MEILEIIAGDDVSLDLVFTEKSGEPVDLTGCTVYFTCKRDPSESDDDALLKAQTNVHVDAVAGETKLAIPRSETLDLPQGQFLGDVQIRDSLGKVSTPSGVFTVRIVKGITTRT